VSARLAEHRAGKADQRAFLWNAWVLENWARKDGQPVAADGLARVVA